MIHDLQHRYIHDLLQRRLDDIDMPLVDIYKSMRKLLKRSYMRKAL